MDPDPGNFRNGSSVFQFLVDILLLGFGSMDPHIFADPKHCFNGYGVREDFQKVQKVCRKKI